MGHTRQIHENITVQATYDHIHPDADRLCKCGCKQQAPFRNGTTGYYDFLKGHSQRLNGIEHNDVKCTFCDSLFGSRAWLVKHVKKQHNYDAKQYYCLTNNLPTDFIKYCECGCGRETTFYSDKGFAQFIVGHQSGKPKEKVKEQCTYQCPQCDKSFKRANWLIRHGRKEHNLKPYEIFLLANGKNKDDIPLCKCGCGAQTTFRSHSEGFSRLLSGHNNAPHCPEPAHFKNTHIKSGKTRSRMFKEGLLTTWNQDLTKETDERLASIGKKISKAKKGVPRSPEHNAKIKAILDEHWSSETNREAQRQRTLDNMTKQKTWCGQGTCYRINHNGDTWLLKSGYELQAYHLLLNDKDVVNVEYESLRIKTMSGSYYLPDFIVTMGNGSKRIIEVKSTFWLNHARWPEKEKAAKEYAASNNCSFEIWTEQSHSFARMINQTIKDRIID